ncbi:MAG: hypothetical protein LBK42_11855 [Propionibacteriaceae bacterium]|jgi:hypothetical protein|nr:hypothetical protein [Propionibacteriaceae bacterium]
MARPYVFDLVVSGLDLDDVAVLDALWSSRLGVTPVFSDGVTTIGFDVEADSDEAALDAATAHLATVPWAVAERVDLDLVSTTEIGVRLDVDRETVRQWATRRSGGADGFPPRFAVIPGGSKPVRVWRWATVHAWAVLHRPDLLAAGEPEPLSPATVDRFNVAASAGGPSDPCRGGGAMTRDPAVAGLAAGALADVRRSRGAGLGGAAGSLPRRRSAPLPSHRVLSSSHSTSRPLPEGPMTQNANAPMTPEQEHSFYARPENQEPQGPARRRQPELSAIVPVRLSPEALDEVRQRATADDRSVSSWIRRAIERDLRHSA